MNIKKEKIELLTFFHFNKEKESWKKFFVTMQSATTKYFNSYPSESLYSSGGETINKNIYCSLTNYW